MITKEPKLNNMNVLWVPRSRTSTVEIFGSENYLD